MATSTSPIWVQINGQPSEITRVLLILMEHTRSRNFTYWGLGIFKDLMNFIQTIFLKLYASLRELIESKNFTCRPTAAFFLIGA